LLFIAGSTHGETWIVDDDEGDWADFQSIQDAIDNANANDTIRIYDGSYEGIVIVERSLTIVGNGSDTVIISRQFDSVLRVLTDNCTISDITIDALTGWIGYGGIYVANGYGSILRNLTLLRLGMGIQISSSDSVSILNCSINGGTTGIYIYGSNDCLLSGIRTNGTYAGLLLLFVSNAVIDGFKVRTVSGPSIYLAHA